MFSQLPCTFQRATKGLGVSQAFAEAGKLLGFSFFFFFPSADFCPPPPCSSLLNLQELGHSYLEPLCFQVKAAKELEENSNKIDSLLNWMASLEQKGGLPEYRPHPVDQGTGKSPGDVPDGHVVGADSAPESLDEQYNRLKVSTDTSSHPKPPDLSVRWVRNT